MIADRDALEDFHPLIARWFSEKVGVPTDVQAAAWPRIAQGENVLVTAPTGSGKTMTAFLWALDGLVSGKRAVGRTTILYVSPLKALNNDIYRNLLKPLGELGELFDISGEIFPEIRVSTRSGDTPQEERRRQLRHPPEILITTPESLNLMLSSAGGRSMLTAISTVILDEVHAVFDSRRGTYLMTAVERLVRLAGEFQRIALSATIKPLEKVAAFTGGFIVDMKGPEPRYTPRKVSIIESIARKRYDLRVFFPEEAAENRERENFWEPFGDAFREIIGRNRSTLLFTNSRRLAEKITLIINGGEEKSLAYAHHGSLSREIREVVESRLKAGELKAIVATSSLEMGIDIGSLDEVVLIQSPFSISSAIQRFGRAGHQVGEASRGALVPTHSRDFINAAVLTKAVIGQDIEAIEPVMCPLDVLAQVIISMTAMETWDIEELFAFIRACYSYRDLSREAFNGVLDMLAGRYAESRIRELKPRISIDRLDNTAAARDGALQILYMCGGVIPDRGYFHMRHKDSNSKIGELDEEFVWENPEGSVFTLGTQSWKVERVTHNDVFVSPSKTPGPLPPFWKGEGFGRDFHFSQRIGQFLEEADEHLSSGTVGVFMTELMEERCMDELSARELIDCLNRQREATGGSLPHRHHLLIEFVESGPDGTPVHQIVLHTLWGGRVNRPLSLALQASWIEQFGYSPEIYASDDSIIIISTHEVKSDEIVSMVSPSSFMSYLRKQLERSGFFGARFRECARRALLVTPNRINQRMPLWLSRLRSQTLLNAVRKYDDFPIMLETWRTCLHDEFDIESLKLVLAELESGAIRYTEAHTAHASLLAQAVTWEQVNIYMYREDQPGSGDPSRLREDLIRTVVFTPGLRPAVSPEIVELFERKRMRLSPGYSPSTARDLLDWVKERILIPEGEWNALLEVMSRDHGEKAEEAVRSAGEKLVLIRAPLSSRPLVVAWEFFPRIVRALFRNDERVTMEPFKAVTAEGFLQVSPSSKTSTVKAEDGSLHADDGAEVIGDAEAVNLEQVAEYYGAEVSPGDDESFNKAYSQADDEAALALVGEWLSFYGPRVPSFLEQSLGLESAGLFIEELIDGQKLIGGKLIAGDERHMICDAENYETLLRMSRKAAMPSFEPLGIERLQLFLAHYQGLTHPGQDVDAVYQALSQLTWYPAPAEMWEGDMLPARVSVYSPSWIDTLMLEGDLVWTGDEQRRVAFCFGADLDLGPGSHEDGSGCENNGPARQPLPLCRFFPEEKGRYDFNALERISGLGSASLNDRLWEEVWLGNISNDTFMSLRRGIENQFREPGSAESGSGTGRPAGRESLRQVRMRSGRKKATATHIGSWYMLKRQAAPRDILSLEEQKKERVRILLERYGILFKEILDREYHPFRWVNLFRTLRIMELSGEVLAGFFFRDVPGPQFISPRAFRILQGRLPDSAIYFMNALDPASMCGMKLEALHGALPRRLPGTHCVYRGSKLVMTSERNGAALNFHVELDDRDLPQIVSPLIHLLTRPFQPLHRITVETVNGEDAAKSPFAENLRTSFEIERDFRHLILYRRRA